MSFSLNAATPSPSPGTQMSTIDCTFESADICKYIQDTTDRFNWTRKTRTTNSRFTGPSNDHTYGTATGISNVVTEVLIIIFGYKFDKYLGFSWIHEKKNWLDNTIKYLLVEGWMEFLITAKYPGYCS